MRRPVWLGLLAGAIAAGAMMSVSTARAEKAFRDEFIAKYVKADSEDAKDKAFAAACEKARCNICHEGKSKKDRNTYGAALGKLIKRADKEDKDKIQAALDKVAAIKSDAKDSKSPTFGELIKAGKLPGGPSKDAKAKAEDVSASSN